MASSLLSGLSGKLIGGLGSLQDLGKSNWGSHELKKLNNTLSAIDAVLVDADEKQRTNPHLQDWLLEIKLVFYDVEDLLLEFSTEALKHQVMAKNYSQRANKVLVFFSLPNRINKMARKVKSIRQRLDEIASKSNLFNLTEHVEDISMVRRRNWIETAHFVPAEDVFGMYEDKKAITKLLLQYDPENNVSVISIVGIGGTGKSILAQLAYNSSEIRQHFDIRVWVYVTSTFSIRHTCEMILESATTKKRSERLIIQMDQLKDELRRAMDGRRYLLVLDDIWNVDPTEWMKLQEVLMGGAQGSKILITARAEVVARAANSVAIHFLKGLSPKESWTLFKKVAFKRGEEPENSTIVGIGREVVNICAGNPLAIMTIGSMLGQKEDEIDWLDFKKNGLQRITQDSEGKTVQILRLSYDYLPAPLKRCLAYCAVFPKDHKIYKTTLIWLWMAQGLVQLDGTTRSLEDVGEKYVQELLARAFFQDCGADEKGDICYYKLQNLMYDLVQSIQGNECCVFGSEVCFFQETTRHAWVSEVIPPNLLNATKLHTLLVKTQVDLGTLADDRTLCSFKNMRVLELAMSKIGSTLHSFIGGLHNLHYLDLSGNTFDFLPESVGNLYNLQTLILTRCRNLKKLPNGIKNLVNLRHLDTTDCDDLRCMPRGFGGLTCLQTLSDFVMWVENRKCAELVELKSLVNLRGTITIRNLRAYKAGKNESGQRYLYPEILTQHKYIRYLWLEWSLKDDVEPEEELLLFQSLQPHPNLEKLYFRDYRGIEFPGWMDIVNIGVSLPNIVYIGITNCTSCKNLPPFGLLPSLEHLFLWDIPGLEYIHNEEDQWSSSESTSSSRGKQLFPSLKKLDLFKMPQLKGLVKLRRTREVAVLLETSQHFPVLEELYICSCPLFTAGSSEEEKQLQNLSSLRSVYVYNSLQEGLQYVPNLKSLTLERCENLVNLPDWMGNLTSLQEIHLKFCESLASIPACFKSLTSLRRLVMRSCPKLRKRCKDETGDDWPNIAHIPDVRIR